MKWLLCIPFFLLFSCSYKNQTAKTPVKDTLNVEEYMLSEEEETEIFYVLLADTSSDYFYLNEKMYNTAEALRKDIDTMGRYYSIEQKRIVLPDYDEDKLYAGNYFPRRFPSDNLSIEYLNLYDTACTNENTMVLIAGIYQSRSVADSCLKSFSHAGHNMHLLITTMYVGCMH